MNPAIGRRGIPATAATDHKVCFLYPENYNKDATWPMVQTCLLNMNIKKSGVET